MRLVLVSRKVVLRFDSRTLSVDDGTTAAQGWPLSDVARILIAHDGGPSRIRIDVSIRHFRWTIGQLYRHNTILPFVAELPDELRQWLLSAGLDGSTVTRRRIRISEYRRR